AAVAGWISKGFEVTKFGDEITDFVRFGAPKPKPVNDKLLKGIVLKADRFGNLITNFTAHDVPQLFSENPPPFKIVIGKHEITKLKNNYAQGVPGELFGIMGSMGYLEISANRAAATKVIGVDKGTEVGILFEASVRAAQETAAAPAT